jgi:WD40 repeat protein
MTTQKALPDVIAPLTDEAMLRGYNDDIPPTGQAIEHWIQSEAESGLLSDEAVATLGDTALLREALKRLVVELRPQWQSHTINTPVGCQYLANITLDTPHGVLWVLDLEGHMSLITVHDGDMLGGDMPLTVVSSEAQAQGTEVLSCAFSPVFQPLKEDSATYVFMALGTSAGTWQLWQYAFDTHRCTRLYEGLVCPEHPKASQLWVSHVAFAQTKRHEMPRVVVLADTQLRGWELVPSSSGAPVCSFTLKALKLPEVMPHRMHGIVWSPSSSEHVALGGYQGVVRYRIGQISPQQTYAWPGVMLNVHWSTDSKYLACGCQDTTLHMWEVKSGKDYRMSGFQGKVQTLAWHPRQLTLAASGGSDISLWDCTGNGPAGKAPLQLLGHLKNVRTLAYSPSGRWLASGGEDGEVLIWDALSPTPVPGSPEDDPLYLPMFRADSELLNPDHATVTHLQWCDTGLLVGFENGLLGCVSLNTEASC